MANHTNSNCRIIAGEESGVLFAFILFVLACWGISSGRAFKTDATKVADDIVDVWLTNSCCGDLGILFFARKCAL